MERPTTLTRRLLPAAAGASAATAINLAIYEIGRAAGVLYIISDTTRVRPPDVALLSAGMFALGMAVASAASRWDRRAWRAMQVVGALVAVVSTAGDIGIQGTRAASATLMLMHLVVGLVYVVTIELVRSRPAELALPATRRGAVPTRLEEAGL
ncbi:MAG TPA: DUF6069 family protein [Acidimicrobiales bacterium]